MAQPIASTPLEEIVRITREEDVLLLELREGASFDAIRGSLREQLSELESGRGHDARLDLRTRAIDLFDLRRLVHVLEDDFEISVAALYCEQSELNQFAERELKLKVYPRSPDVEIAGTEVSPVEKEIAAPEVLTATTPSVVEIEETDDEAPQVTKEDLFNDSLYQESQTEKVLTLKRSIRSGQKVRYAGDVILYGDVNPGAEVIAGGNIVVMGALKGLCHAGARGDDSAIIIAFDCRPAQIRIGRKIAIPPERPARVPKTYTPEVAWVRGGEILIEPYAGHLPQ